MAFLRHQRRFRDRLKTFVGKRQSQLVLAPAFGPTTGLSNNLLEAPFCVKHCFPK
jgi:hypothetical protein